MQDAQSMTFTCRRCGTCCRIPGLVHLQNGEQDALASYLGMDVMDFIDRYTALSPDRRGLVLQDNSAGACSLLGDDGLCRVNAVKPAQCRAFPFSWTNSDSATICPALAESTRSDYKSLQITAHSNHG